MALFKSSFVIVSRGNLAACAGRETVPTVVLLGGEHDIATADALWETMVRAIAVCDADLVVDLGGVQFMGASTIGVLVRARTRLQERSRSMTLRSPTPFARRVLDACGLTDLIDAHPATDDHRAAALATWVAVPASDPLDDHADASMPTASGAQGPGPVRPLSAGRASPAGAEVLATALATSVVARQGS